MPLPWAFEFTNQSLTISNPPPIYKGICWEKATANSYQAKQTEPISVNLKKKKKPKTLARGEIVYPKKGEKNINLFG